MHTCIACVWTGDSINTLIRSNNGQHQTGWSLYDDDDDDVTTTKTSKRFDSFDRIISLDFSFSIWFSHSLLTILILSSTIFQLTITKPDQRRSLLFIYFFSEHNFAAGQYLTVTLPIFLVNYRFSHDWSHLADQQTKKK